MDLNTLEQVKVKQYFEESASLKLPKDLLSHKEELGP